MRYPTLYSFRRCPYAMRARLAIRSSGVSVELREIILRDKPQEFLSVSPSKTVPMLVLPDGEVIDESLDIMLWALAKSDPEGWLEGCDGALALISHVDADFKPDLDAYKYASRDTREAGIAARDRAAAFLGELEASLAQTQFLGRVNLALADMAIAPFIRQFANVDRLWFDAQPWPNLSRWLGAFLASERFGAIMMKYPPWQADAPPIRFR